MGGDPGIGHEAEGGVRLWLHRHQKPGQQLLPQHSDAGPLQHPRLPEDVSTVRFNEDLLRIKHNIDNIFLVIIEQDILILFASNLI